MSKRNDAGYYPIPNVGENIMYPSVTTICKVLDKFQLRAWAASVDVDWFREHTIGRFLRGEINENELRELDLDAIAKEAKGYHTVVSKEATDYGTRIHHALNIYHNTGAWPIDPELRDAFKACIEEEVGAGLTVIESEKMIYSQTFSYAGTLDLHCICHLEDTTGIVDYKTHGGDKAITYPEHLLQLGAYVAALEEMTGKFLDFGDVVYLSRATGLATRKRFRRVQLIRPFSRFVCLCNYFHLTRGKP